MKLVTHRGVRRLLTVGVLAVALFGLAPSAHADPPVAQGWWWAPQLESTALPGQVAGLVPEQTGPQGVPDNGLYVAGSAASEEAVAALRFFVPEGAEPTTLTLVLAGEPTGTPVIRLCAVTTSWTPEQQGAWSGRPEFECADDAPVGVLSDDATTVTFDLTGFTLVGSVDFGLAPGVDDTGNVATFQAPIEKPGVDALTIERDDPDGPAVAPVVAPTTTNPPASQTKPYTPPATAVRLPQLPAASGGVNPAPVATRVPAVVSAGGGDFAAAPIATTPTELSFVPASSGNSMRTFGMVGLLALAAFYAWLTGQESRPARSLLEFGRGSSGPVINAEALQ